MSRKEKSSIIHHLNTTLALARASTLEKLHTHSLHTTHSHMTRICWEYLHEMEAAIYRDRHARDEPALPAHKKSTACAISSGCAHLCTGDRESILASSSSLPFSMSP